MQVKATILESETVVDTKSLQHSHVIQVSKIQMTLWLSVWHGNNLQNILFTKWPAIAPAVIHIDLWIIIAKENLNSDAIEHCFQGSTSPVLLRGSNNANCTILSSSRQLMKELASWNEVLQIEIQNKNSRWIRASKKK